ncbi:hypothetical protein J1614_010959 [Plenodomus biglobosus]|nr:hypothetical protein J1614_010959 [Plenodomus biglobosus]
MALPIGGARAAFSTSPIACDTRTACHHDIPAAPRLTMVVMLQEWDTLAQKALGKHSTDSKFSTGRIPGSHVTADSESEHRREELLAPIQRTSSFRNAARGLVPLADIIKAAMEEHIKLEQD